MELFVETKELPDNAFGPLRETKTKIIYYIILISLVVSSIVLIYLMIISLNSSLSPNFNYIMNETSFDFISVSGLIYIILYFSLIASLILLEISPVVLFTSISYKRTGYIYFALESIYELLLLIGMDLLAVVLPRIGSFLGIILFLIIIILIPILIIEKNKVIKKPLISDRLAFRLVYDTADIIQKQAQNIAEFEDAYSLRPIFDNMKESLSDIEDKNEITLLLHNFTKFLLINGDLIALDFEDKKIKLYLRTTFFAGKYFFKFRSRLKKLMQVIKKDNLTCVTIDLESLDISIRLNSLDYERLENATYLKLGEHVLQQFKIAISEFKEKNYSKSYEALNPKITGYRSRNKPNKKKRPENDIKIPKKMQKILISLNKRLIAKHKSKEV